MCRNGWAFKFKFMFYKLRYSMCCHVTLTVLLKIEIAPAHSLLSLIHI